jgi:hypothetical protein
MAQRLIIKTDREDGIPWSYEIGDFERKKGVNINEVPRLYVSFKVGKRRKLKRLRLKKTSYPCELCGYHTYISGTVGKTPFDKEI